MQKLTWKKYVDFSWRLPSIRLKVEDLYKNILINRDR